MTLDDYAALRQGGSGSKSREVALAKLHHLIEKQHRRAASRGAVLFNEPNVRRTQKMQLLFY